MAHARALARVLSSAQPAETAHDLRILMNRGDWRDPVERHHDSMTELTIMATHVVAAIGLWLVQSIG